MLEPLAIGNWILNEDVSDDRTTMRTSGRTGVKTARETSRPKVSVPRTMTPMMYQRPRGGRSRSKAKYTPRHARVLRKRVTMCYHVNHSVVCAPANAGAFSFDDGRSAPIELVNSRRTHS